MCDMNVRCVVLLMSAAVAVAAVAKGSRGLYAGPGALSPMEERLERGSSPSGESRVNKAVKARRKLQDNVPAAQPIAGGEKVRYVKVTKNCPCEKQTIKATCGAKVGVGKTAAAAKAAASGRQATNKATW